MGAKFFILGISHKSHAHLDRGKNRNNLFKKIKVPNIVMMGTKIVVFEVAESIPGFSFTRGCMVFDLEGPRPFYFPRAWEFL